MNKKITFTNMFEVDFYPPQPAQKQIPDWYKKTPEYFGQQGKKISPDGIAPNTIKKCIPVFDAMTAGYILFTQVDVQVSQIDGLPYYNWSSQDAIAMHPVEQGASHPSSNGAPFPKWVNSYAIQTPPGYSCLFVPPLHNPNEIFNVLPGLVDTDTYASPVNFPFVLNDVKWEGMIPAGTPMVQVIPIKRDSWKSETGSTKEIKQAKLIDAKLKTMFFNSYKKQFWSRKEYR